MASVVYLVFQKMNATTSFQDVMGVAQSFGRVRGKKMVQRDGYMNCILSFEEERDAKMAEGVLNKYASLVHARLGNNTTVKLKSVVKE